MILPQDILCRQHSRKHGVVHVIVTVHAAPADGLKVFKVLKVFFDDIKLLIISPVINGVRLGLAKHKTVLYFSVVDKIQFHQLPGGHLQQVGVGHRPDFISFGTEVFHAYVCLFRIRNHGVTPVPKVLDAAHSNIRAVNIQPLIRKKITLVYYEPYHNKGPVREPGARLKDPVRCRRFKNPHKFAQRGTGDDVPDRYFFRRATVHKDHTCDQAVLMLQGGHS